jgi:hypothetical protein
MVFGGRKLGLRHQGHVVKQDVRLGNLWQTMFSVVRAPIPDDFQGGEADGVIGDILA